MIFQNVIDGDLLKTFPYMRSERQLWVAQQVDKSVPDILRFLDEMSARIW